MKQKHSSRKLRLITIGGVLGAAVLTIAFVALVYRITTTQTMRIGKQQLLNMSEEVDSMIYHAAYEVNELAETVEMMTESGAQRPQIEEYIESQSKLHSKLSKGIIFRVCYTRPGCIIVPGEEISDDFDIASRSWYQGAVAAGTDKTYISNPYADYFKESICFSVAKLLSDGVTTVSFDYTMEQLQQFLSELPNESGQAILVNEDGLIVGANMEGMNGRQFEEAMPSFTRAWKKIKYANDPEGSFRQGGTIYLYNITENGWYLIYSVNDFELHGSDYLLLMALLILVALGFCAVLFLLVRSRQSEKTAAEALEAREAFFTNLKGEFRNPIERINELTKKGRWADASDVEHNLVQIREESLILNRLFDNLLAYSTIKGEETITESTDEIISQKENKKEEKKTEKIDDQARFMRHMGSLATSVLLLLILVVILFASYLVVRQGRITMNNRTDAYYGELQKWVSSRKNTMDMMANMLEADSSILNDYDGCVEYLNTIAKDYEGISLIYVGNAQAENSIIMSDGWTNNGNYVVQAYSWYANARSSREGYEISSVHYDMDSREYVITFSEELMDAKGQFVGVLGIDFNVSDLIATLESMYTDYEYAFLVTNSGTIMNHPNEEYQISYRDTVSIDDSVYSRLQSQEKMRAIFDYDHSLVMCDHREEAVSGFQIYVVRSWGSIYGTIVIASTLFVSLIIFSVILVTKIWKRVSVWREQTNQKLEVAVDEAYEANQAKSRFLAQMSHEIRTPINAVLGMNEMILRESEDMSILDHAKDIKQAGKTLLLLVNSILDFSKIENGNDEVVLIKYSTKELIDNLISEIRPLANEHHLELIADIDDMLPSKLYGDRVRIMQVVINLLTNAVKYTPQGSVTIKMSGAYQENGDYLLHVSVKDTGIGIRDEDRGLLFTSFQRLDMEKNHSVEGTGLGLYIVNHFLEKMDSKLNLDSVYGEGSNFYFDLVQGVIDETPIGSETGENSKEKEKQIQYLYAPNAHVLVVDDNQMNRKVALALLKRSEMKVDLAESGEQCLSMLKTQSYDIVLLDQMMPGMDGIETLGQIRNQNLLPDGIPVIVMTAHAISGAREQYLEAGFDDYVSKPIDSAVLEETLIRWLPKDKCQMKTVEEDQDARSKSVNTVHNVTENKPAISDAGEVEVEAENKVEYRAESEKEINAETESTLNSRIFRHEMLNKLAQALPDIDLESGLTSCGLDEDFYVEILKEFSQLEIGTELQKFYEGDDSKNYTISIHGFKNNAYSVGLAELGDLAFAMEESSRSGLSEELFSMQQKLLEDYSRICKCIQENSI